jgi:hypothetical protein
LYPELLRKDAFGIETPAPRSWELLALSGAQAAARRSRQHALETPGPWSNDPIAGNNNIMQPATSAVHPNLFYLATARVISESE